ncbi:MAG: NAD(P)-binding protein [Comamonadaceae bacterium]|uniref:NAD(P)-binding protein n=1 Tax=Candidatus Skiveiella danica TaxID=3386177 RepID=UPI00390B8C5D|nr:NAD(P)-binding protein [Comamonadaceae bacterium]
MKSAYLEDLVILGAGISGISARFHARKMGIEAVIYEANGRAGGLLDNFTVRGSVSIMPCTSFASEPEVQAIFDTTRIFRISGIVVLG